MDIWTILALALATAFVLSALDFWVYIVFWRGLIGLAVAGLLGFWLGLEPAVLSVSALAAGFLALAVVEIMDKVTKTAIRVTR